MDGCSQCTVAPSTPEHNKSHTRFNPWLKILKFHVACLRYFCTCISVCMYMYVSMEVTDQDGHLPFPHSILLSETRSLMNLDRLVGQMTLRMINLSLFPELRMLCPPVIPPGFHMGAEEPNSSPHAPATCPCCFFPTL